MKFLRLIPSLALAFSLAAETFAAGPDAEKTRQLLATVQSDGTLAERTHALQTLALMASSDAAPAVAGLLADPRLGQYARDVLEQMPAPEAGDALRAALDQLHGNALVGVINSLGVRRDAKAEKTLERLAGETGSPTAGPALLALGRIGTPEASRFLESALKEGPASLRGDTAEGCLLLARGRLDAGDKPGALALFQAVRGGSVPARARVSATRAIVLAQGPDGLELLGEELRTGDAEMRAVMLGTIRELPGKRTGPVLIAKLDRFDGPTQALVIGAVADLEVDPDVVAAIEARARDGAGSVRLAAIAALGKVGGDSSLPILLAAAQTEPADPRATTALASLTRISAPGANRAILAALSAAEPAVRCRLIAALGERGAVEAAPELFRLAQDPDSRIAAAAWGALGLTAGPEDQSRLIGLAIDPRDAAVREPAARAIAAVAMKEIEPDRRAAGVLAALRQADAVSAKIALLPIVGTVIGRVGNNQEVFFAVKGLLANTTAATGAVQSEAAVRAAALRCLTEWPDATPVTTLLAFAGAKATTADQRGMALLGALRQLTRAAGGKEKTPLNLAQSFDRAEKLSDTPEEKRLVATGRAALARLAAAQVVARVVPNAPNLGSRSGPSALGTTRTTFPAVSLFNGKDLTGWQGDPAVWRVRAGLIVGGSLDGNPQNEFLATTRSYKNFLLRAEYKLIGTKGTINSGIQFRSIHLDNPPNEMYGYQADIGNGHSGGLYDESRRKIFLMAADPEQIKRLEKPGEWNRYEVRCDGPQMEIWLNGERTAAYTETDPTLPQDGLIGLQIHGHGQSEVSFRNLVIEERP